jgi:hypothetical protein
MPRTHRRDARLAPAALGLALALVLVSSRASSQPLADFGHLNPDAPPETSQFAFLVGQWDCAVHTMNPDGETFRDSTATWTGYYILDGWAIKDDWTTRRPDGTAFHGTNIRSFNPRTHSWDNRWLPSGSLQWTYFEAEQVGDTMVMIGGAGRDEAGEYLDRNTFHDIQADSWKWRKDRSRDGGVTWVEGVSRIEATRVK